jgi:hypothetical protein
MRRPLLRSGQLVIRYEWGPWHDAVWTPANPAGVLPVLRLTGWTGAYRRHHIDHRGRWVYRWLPDYAAPLP